jgi:hypothetical protein
MMKSIISFEPKLKNSNEKNTFKSNNDILPVNII